MRGAAQVGSTPATPFDTLWGGTHATPEAYVALAAPLEVEVAVIGGGFTGLSAALHAAQAGAQVAVFEAGRVGQRASGRNGGQVVPGFKPLPPALIARFGEDVGRRMVRMAYNVGNELFDLVDRHRIDCAPTRGGWIQGAFSDGSVQTIRERVATINAYGGDVAFLDGDAMREATGSTFWPAGLLEKTAGAVQPLAYARGLAQAGVGAGVQIFEHSPVSVLAPASSKTGAMLTVNGHAVRARRVVLATDAYTDTLWPAVAQSYVNVSSAQIATEPLPDEVAAAIMPRRAGASEARKITYYCRMDPGNRFVIGGRGRSLTHLDDKTREQLRAAAIARFPALAQVRWEFGWACRVGMTIDDLPRVHELAPGVFTAYGYCGRGVGMGTVLGRVLAEAVRGAASNTLDFPVTPVARLPFYPLKQWGASAAIQYYRMRDALGFPA
ncbi:MAG: FAD-binding oxidoreductase [Burkholderiaceae bacterium]|nr:FAD-binding oxidoreductase [Burkholderiaceae bacterium]